TAASSSAASPGARRSRARRPDGVREPRVRSFLFVTLTKSRPPGRGCPATPPRVGSSPLVVGRLLRRAPPLVLPPGFLVLGDVPAVPVDVMTHLLTDLLRAQEAGEKARAGHSQALRLRVRERKQVVGDRDADLHALPAHPTGLFLGSPSGATLR